VVVFKVVMEEQDLDDGIAVIVEEIANYFLFK